LAKSSKINYVLNDSNIRQRYQPSKFLQHKYCIQPFHTSNRIQFLSSNRLQTIQNNEPLKEEINKGIENEKLTHKSAQSAKDDVNTSETKPTAIAKKKPLMTRIKDELVHYWDGTKLLGLEIKISTKLLYKLMKGHKLTRREYRQVTFYYLIELPIKILNNFKFYIR